jgi:hypothetical protein
MRRFRMLATLTVAIAMLAPHAGQASAVQVSHDLADDWGFNVAGDGSLSPVGDALGMELVGAAIDNVDTGKVNFVIQLKSLPANGGTPEVARYFWDFNVNGQLRELDGKFTNYSRGACDPTAGSCPPPRDPGPAPFFVRGDCSVTGTTTLCHEIGVVQAIFDPASATITIPVTSALLGYSTCADIEPVDNGFSGTLTAVPAAFLSENGGPWDSLYFDDEIESVTVC